MVIHKFVIVLIVFGWISSCKTADVNMTDEFIEVNKPGQQFGIIKIEAQKFDSTFGYPIEEKELTAATLVNRITKKQIKGNEKIKIYFSKKHSKYLWKIYNNPFLADFIYSDTIQIKPKTWYRYSIENRHFTYYFYWTGNKNDFITKVKPDPGAW